MRRSYWYVLFLAALAASLWILAACQARSAPTQAVGQKVAVGGGSYTNLTPTELKAQLEAKDFVLVNVHTPFEGDLPKTDLSIPYDQIAQNLDKLPQDKNAKIVLYCRSGRMSDIAARELLKKGYTNLWNLAGGMIAWEKAGFEILK